MRQGARVQDSLRVEWIEVCKSQGFQGLAFLALYGGGQN